MAGEGGHVGVEHFEQNANALFTVGKFFDDPQSGWMPQSLANFRSSLDR